MDAHSLSRHLHHAMLGEFELTPWPDGGVRVRTPLLLPDRDMIDVFVVERDGGFVVTDYGDTLGWIAVQSVKNKVPQSQLALIQEVCRSLGLVIDHGEIVARDVSLDQLPSAVFSVAQGIMRVADSAYTARIRSAPSTAADIRSLLKGCKVPFERNTKRQGASGRTWKVDFETHAPRCTGLIYVLSTASHPAGARMVKNLVSGIDDLLHNEMYEELRAPMSFVAVFNDLTNVWWDRDYAHTANFAEVVRWSKPDARDHLLHAIGASRG